MTLICQATPMSKLEMEANEAFRRGDILRGVALQTASMVEKAKQVDIFFMPMIAALTQ